MQEAPPWKAALCMAWSSTVLGVPRSERERLDCQDPGVNLVWSKISNALKGLGFRSHNFLAQLLSETHMVKIFDRFEKAQLAPRTR
jgi:hypothetical protein